MVEAKTVKEMLRLYGYDELVFRKDEIEKKLVTIIDELLDYQKGLYVLADTRIQTQLVDKLFNKILNIPDNLFSCPLASEKVCSTKRKG